MKCQFFSSVCVCMCVCARAVCCVWMMPFFYQGEMCLLGFIKESVIFCFCFIRNCSVLVWIEDEKSRHRFFQLSTLVMCEQFSQRSTKFQLLLLLNLIVLIPSTLLLSRRPTWNAFVIVKVCLERLFFVFFIFILTFLCFLSLQLVGVMCSFLFLLCLHSHCVASIFLQIASSNINSSQRGPCCYNSTHALHSLLLSIFTTLSTERRTFVTLSHLAPTAGIGFMLSNSREDAKVWFLRVRKSCIHHLSWSNSSHIVLWLPCPSLTEFLTWSLDGGLCVDVSLLSYRSVRVRLRS